MRALSLVLLFPFLAAAAPAAPPAPAPASPPAAKIGDQVITLAEVDQAAAADLYEARDRALDRMIDDRVLGPLAKKAGMSVDEYVMREVEKRIPEVSEQEAREFFEANKDKLEGQHTFDEVKPMVIRFLTNEKRKQAAGGVVEELRKQAGVQVLLEPPHIEVAAVGPVRGNAKAKVTIVEFSDFQCPYCARGRKTIDEVLKKYAGKVRVVYRDFPLSFHEHAQKAAEAGRCADEQKKFWQLHDWMFDHQDQLAVEDLEKAAKKLGLDGKKFHDCLSSGRTAPAIAASVEAGTKAGVHGTPAFFVNGVFLNGALPLESFAKEIDRALQH